MKCKCNGNIEIYYPYNHKCEYFTCDKCKLYGTLNIENGINFIYIKNIILNNICDLNLAKIKSNGHYTYDFDNIFKLIDNIEFT